jgi:hypothetical protein
MATDTKASLGRWLLLFAIVPSVLSFALLNVLLWQRLWSSHVAGLEGEAKKQHAFFEQRLRAEAERLRLLARHPSIQALFAPAPETTNVAASSGPSGDALQLLTSIVDVEPLVRRLAVTDASGGVLAASAASFTANQRDQDAWLLSVRAPRSLVSSDGLSPDGEISLSLACRAAPETNGQGRLLGVIGSRIAAAGRTEISHADDSRCLALLSPSLGVLLEEGGENAAEFLALLRRQLKNGGADRGWKLGHRYSARRIDAGIYWLRPMWVLSARREPMLPPSLLVPMVGSVALCVGLSLGVIFLARCAARRMFFDAMMESSEAGLWVLRTAFRREADSESYAARHPWVGLREDADAPIRKDLERWMTGYREALSAHAGIVSGDMRHDLELATEFLHAFLNRPYPQVPAAHVEGRLRLEFSHRYKPALAIGGDFFDIKDLGKDAAGVLVVDVMGHGTRSALVTAILRTLLSDLYASGRNPTHFLRELNKLFCSMLKTLPEPFFASAAYFVADTTARTATYAIAGHPPPFHIHRNTGRIQLLEVPQPRGAALGLIPTEDYGGSSIRLLPNDAFLFYTDGAYEAANPLGEEFGLERMEHILQAGIYKPTEQLLDDVMEAILSFMGDEPITDDICLVSVDIRTDRPGALAPLRAAP